GGTLTGPANGPAIGQQRASKGPEEESIISIRERRMLARPSPAGFDDWYSIYPKKKQPQDAKKAFAKVIGSKVIALPVLIEKTKTFAASWADKPKADRKYIP